MKRLILYFGKKYVVQALNDVLKKYSTDVFKVTTTISIWTTRLEKIIELLKKINNRISDGQLDDDEIETSKRDFTLLVKEF